MFKKLILRGKEVEENIFEDPSSFVAQQLYTVKKYNYLIIIVSVLIVLSVIYIFYLKSQQKHTLNLYITDKKGDTYLHNETETETSYTDYVLIKQIANYVRRLNTFEAGNRIYHGNYKEVKYNLDTISIIRLLSNNIDYDLVLSMQKLNDLSQADIINCEILEVKPNFDREDSEQFRTKQHNIYEILKIYSNGNHSLRFDLKIRLLFYKKINTNNINFYIEFIPPIYKTASVDVTLLSEDYTRPTDIYNNIDIDLHNPLRLRISNYIFGLETNDPKDIGYIIKKSKKDIHDSYRREGLIRIKQFEE